MLFDLNSGVVFKAIYDTAPNNCVSTNGGSHIQLLSGGESVIYMGRRVDCSHFSITLVNMAS